MFAPPFIVGENQQGSTTNPEDDYIRAMCGRFIRKYPWSEIHALGRLMVPAALPNVDPRITSDRPRRRHPAQGEWRELLVVPAPNGYLNTGWSQSR
jgi:hypothetical protein